MSQPVTAPPATPRPAATPTVPLAPPRPQVAEFYVDNLYWDVWEENSKDDPVNAAGFSLFAQGQTDGTPLASATADGEGIARLDLTGVPPGRYRLRVLAPYTSTAIVGPDFSPSSATKNTKARIAGATDGTYYRVFRPMELDVQLANGTLTSVTLAGGFEGQVSRKGAQWWVRLMPCWVYGRHNSRDGQAISLIVLHHSQDKVTGHNVPVWGTGEGPHYFIDPEGRIVKMVEDHLCAWHAPGRWRGKDVNKTSIGIEIIHEDGMDYKEAQYTSVLWLIERLIARHGIPRYNVIGHQDSGGHKNPNNKITDPFHKKKGWLNRGSHGHDEWRASRPEDPGFEFEWKRLEDKGIGLIPTPNAWRLDWHEAYGGFFANAEPWAKLIRGDSDQARIFGGKIRKTPEELNASASPTALPGRLSRPASGLTEPIDRLTQDFPRMAAHVAFALERRQALQQLPAPRLSPRFERSGDRDFGVGGMPITELQRDLKVIGYPLPAVNGLYDQEMEFWVGAFQRHFFARGRGGSKKSPLHRDGYVDYETAEMIKMVLAFVNMVTGRTLVPDAMDNLP